MMRRRLCGLPHPPAMALDDHPHFLPDIVHLRDLHKRAHVVKCPQVLDHLVLVAMRGGRREEEGDIS